MDSACAVVVKRLTVVGINIDGAIVVRNTALIHRHSDQRFSLIIELVFFEINGALVNNRVIRASCSHACTRIINSDGGVTVVNCRTASATHF